MPWRNILMREMSSLPRTQRIRAAMRQFSIVLAVKKGQGRRTLRQVDITFVVIQV